MTAAPLIKSHKSFYKSFHPTGYSSKPNIHKTNIDTNSLLANLAGKLLKALFNNKGTFSTSRGYMC